MILNYFAKMILDLSEKYKLGGEAFCYGDQKTSFSREYIESGFKNYGGERMETAEFFKYCGFSNLTDLDYNGNAKICVDLGKPIPKELHDRAAILYDGGTIEHIPNILQAVMNAVHLVKEGGIVIHAVPFGIYNNCYFHVDPLFFKDFYEANGFETVDCFMYYYHTNIVKKWLKVAERIIVKDIKPKYPSLFKAMKATPIQKLGTTPARLKNLKEFEKGFRTIKLDGVKLNYYIRFGFPFGTHTVYVGKKKNNLKEIVIPCQETYPNMIKKK